MKIQAATLVFLVSITAPALAQSGRWTLNLEGRAICGTLTRDRAGLPLEFTTSRGFVLRIADYPSLTTKRNLHQGCREYSINSAMDADELATPENEEKARRAAREEKEREYKDIEEWLKEHCHRHPDEPGCTD